MRVFCTPVDRWCRGAALSLDWKPTPYFSFCLSTRAARIQTSVWLHTLFSGEPVEIQPFNTLLPLRPVREQRAGRGGDFSFWSDLIFLQPSPLFSSFTRLTDFGVVKSARRCSQSHASLFFFVYALRLRGNGLISVFFSPTSASTKLRKQSL